MVDGADLVGGAAALLARRFLTPFDEGIEVSCHRLRFPFNACSTFEENFSDRIRCKEKFSTKEKNL
jgi:hypothetical protein